MGLPEGEEDVGSLVTAGDGSRPMIHIYVLFNSKVGILLLILLYSTGTNAIQCIVFPKNTLH